LLIGLSSNLLVVAFIFFFVYVFRFDPNEERWHKTEYQLQNIQDRINSLQTELQTVRADINEALVQQIFSRRLNGTYEIYSVGRQLCTKLNERMQAVVYTTGPKAPPEWAEAVSSRLAETKAQGVPAKFDVILVANSKLSKTDFVREMDRRNQIYKSRDVFDQVSLWIIDSQPEQGFDVLVLDRKHAIISFTKTAGISTVQSGILFENEPKIASDLSDWFDQLLIRKAVPFDLWLEQEDPNS
jgi:hypothetical protein